MRHLGALGHLARDPHLSYSDLARRAGVTSQSMHATVRGLEEMGAVRRVLPGAGHPARLEVTQTGRDLLDGVREAAAHLDRLVLRGLSSQRQRDVTEIVSVLLPPPRASGDDQHWSQLP